MKDKLFSYNYVDTPVHRLSGLTKLICFLFLTFAVMFSYDIRVILFVMAFSLVILKISRIKFSQIRLMIIYVSIFLVTNAVITFFFFTGGDVSALIVSILIFTGTILVSVFINRGRFYNPFI